MPDAKEIAGCYLSTGQFVLNPAHPSWQSAPLARQEAARECSPPQP